MLREADAGGPPRRAGGGSAETGLGRAAHKGGGVVAQRLLGRERDAWDVFVAQAGRVEADLLEQSRVVGRLVSAAHGLGPNAAGLHLAAGLLVDRRAVQQLGPLTTDRAKLVLRSEQPVDDPVERARRERDAEHDR